MSIEYLILNNQIFIFTTPAHRCSEPVTDGWQSESLAFWEDVLPWISRERGYPSGCSRLDPAHAPHAFRNLSATYFSSLELQETDLDRFTAIRCKQDLYFNYLHDFQTKADISD